MAGMTMTEKILAKHSGKTRVSAGENVWVNVDVLMTHRRLVFGSFSMPQVKLPPLEAIEPLFKLGTSMMATLSPVDLM